MGLSENENVGPLVSKLLRISIYQAQLGTILFVGKNWINYKKDKFLETQNLPTLNHEETEILNRSITTSKETKSVIKTSQEIKVQDQMTSVVNSTIQGRINTHSSHMLQKK